VVLANARMLGANASNCCAPVYLPAQRAGLFSTVHTSVGLAFVGAVGWRIPRSARGVGYSSCRRGHVRRDTVFAGNRGANSFRARHRWPGRAHRDSGSMSGSRGRAKRKSSSPL